MTGAAFRRHRLALAIVPLVVAILFLQPLLRREVFTFRDHSDYFQPLRYFTAIHIRDLVLPYWNPYSASGEQWLANPQVAAFYPPAWLYVGLPFETAYMLYLALHLAVLGWGAYLLFARGAREGAALAGAVAVMVCGPVLSLMDVQNNLTTFAWVPLILWSAAARVRPQIAAVLLALAFLGGEPFFAALAALLYVVVVRSLPHVAIAGAGAFGLAAIQLLPFLDWIRGSDRAARLPSAQILAESMRPLDWWRVAVPPALPFDPALSQHFIPAIYVGIAVAMLALVGVLSKAGRGWLALLAASIIISAGSYLPTGLEHLPLTLFRYPSRVIPFGALAIIGLAVLGWDGVAPRRRWADSALILVILLDVVPRMQPLLQTAPWKPAGGLYPASVGRAAKMIRIPSGPIRDREAWMAGYVNLYHRRFDAGTAAPIVSERYARVHDRVVTDARLDLLNLLSIGFVLSDHAIPAFEPIAAHRGVTVYRNRHAPQMATFWTAAREFATPDEALQAALDKAVAPILPVAGRIDARLSAAVPAIHPVELLSIDTRTVRVVVSAPADGVLLVAQQDAPGWRVRVDGMEREKLAAAGILLGVPLKRGRHEVIWQYDPPSLRAGIVMTLITALSLQLSMFVKRARGKNFSS